MITPQESRLILDDMLTHPATSTQATASRLGIPASSVADAIRGLAREGLVTPVGKGYVHAKLKAPQPPAPRKVTRGDDARRAIASWVASGDYSPLLIDMAHALEMSKANTQRVITEMVHDGVLVNDGDRVFGHRLVVVPGVPVERPEREWKRSGRKPGGRAATEARNAEMDANVEKVMRDHPGVGVAMIARHLELCNAQCNAAVARLVDQGRAVRAEKGVAILTEHVHSIPKWKARSKAARATSSAPSNISPQLNQFILEWVVAWGYNPGNGVIARAVGVSKETVASRVRKMRREGLLEVDPWLTASHNIVATSAGRDQVDQWRKAGVQLIS